MILSGKELIKEVKDKRIIDSKEGSIWSNFTGWNFDLRLGHEVYITSWKTPKELKDNEYLIIRPGEFALLTSLETFNMPKNIMGFISIKLKYKSKGLINISGFHVDPYFRGKLVFSAYNAGPSDIVLQQGDSVFMVFFASLFEPLEEEQDKLYLVNMETTEINTIKKSIEDTIKRRKDNHLNRIPLEMVCSIRGTSVSLANNNARIDKLESSIKIYGSIAIAIIAGLLLLILQLSGN